MVRFTGILTEERAFTLMVSNDGERPVPLSGPLLRNVHIDAS